MPRLRQLEPTQKVIGDNTFYIRPLPAMVAANLSGDLTSLLLPLISGILPLVGNDGEEEKSLMDVDVTQAASTLSKSMDGLSGAKIEAMMKKLLVTYKNVVVEMPVYDGDVPTGDTTQEYLTMDIVNEIFCGQVQDMFILAYYVIAQNFGGFFEKLVGQSGTGGEVTQKKIRKIL